MAKVISRVLHYVFSQTTVLAAAGRNRNEHSQYTEDSPHNYDSGLFKRDACADAFGSGWSANTCTPGTTLCCVNPAQPIPFCQQDLGLGWCCTQDGGCYADLASACGQPGAVECTELGAGVKQACCPQSTTCASGYNATLEWVRCNIRQTALSSLGSSQSTLSGASTASSLLSSVESTTTSHSTAASSSATTSSSSSEAVISTSTPITAATDVAATNTATASQTSSGLTSGGIAGVVIGAAAGGLLIAGLLWFILRRRKRQRKEMSEFSETQDQKVPQYLANGGGRPTALRQDLFGGPPKVELPGSDVRDPVELPSERT